MHELVDVIATAVSGYAQGNGNGDDGTATAIAGALRTDEDMKEAIVDVVLGLKNAAYARGLAAATATGTQGIQR